MGWQFRVVAAVTFLVTLVAACTTTTSNPSNSGTITVEKTVCESIGQQNTCNGRDMSVSGYKVDRGTLNLNKYGNGFRTIYFV